MINFILKIVACYYLLITISINSFSQIKWAYGMGELATVDDIGQAIAVDKSGNVYTSGKYMGGVDFNPGVGISTISGGNGDVFLLKLNSEGNFLWVKNISGLAITSRGYITTDPMNNVLMIGDLDNNGTLGCGPIYGNGYYILKMDSLGNCLWNFTHNLPIYSVIADKEGNVYTIGSFSGTIDFDFGSGIYQLSSPTPSTFILKLNASGDFVWVKNYGPTVGASFSSLAVDSFSNIYTTGVFEGIVDFNPSGTVNNLNSLGLYSSYILKLDSSGNYVWAKQFTGLNGQTSIPSIAVSDLGNVYTFGLFRDDIDFNPNSGTYYLSSAQYFAIYISKLDQNGNFKWAKKIRNDPQPLFSCTSSSIALDGEENVYATGNFAGVIDFDPDSSVSNLSVTDSINSVSTDLFILKLDSMGNFLWVKKLGDTSSTMHSTIGTDITVDKNGNAFVTGSFTRTMQMDINGSPTSIASTGKNDILIVKLGSCTSASITTNGSTLTSTYSGATSYQWVSCSPYAVIAGATNKDYTPTTNGSYALVLTQNGCVDTSSCYSLTTVNFNNHNLINKINASPNPTNSIIYFSSKTKFENLSYKLFTTSGELVLENRNITGYDFFVDISSQPVGIYFIQLMNSEQASHLKIIKY